MELTPALIGLFLTALITFAGLIAWAIRLESKTNQAKIDIEKVCKDSESEITRLENQNNKLELDIYKELTETNKKLEAHKDNSAVHHNSELVTFQFQTMQDTIKELKATMKTGFEKMDKYFGLDK